MYFVQTADDGLLGPFENEKGALGAMIGHEIEDVHEGKLTPELLTAMRMHSMDTSTPYSMEDLDWQIEDLECLVEVPVEKFAEDAVQSELEQQAREEYTPADAHPMENEDTYLYVREYIDKRVNEEAFRAEGCGEAYDKFVEKKQDEVRDVISQEWDQR